MPATTGATGAAVDTVLILLDELDRILKELRTTARSIIDEERKDRDGA